MEKREMDKAVEQAQPGAEGLPNVILVMTDQMRADHLGCYGQQGIRTPNIDGLAAAGTRFERCYVASPVCMPNRASIFTGRHPSAHRVRMNGIPLSLQENTFVELLRLRGYRTALVGKAHLQNMYDMPPLVREPAASPGKWVPPKRAREAYRYDSGQDYGQELSGRWEQDEPPPLRLPFYGFEHVRFCTEHGDLVGGHYRHWLREQGLNPAEYAGPRNSLPHDYVCPQAWRTRMPEELYPTRYVQNEAADFLKRHAKEGAGQPFFLTVSFPDPHHPFTPPGRYWGMYAPEEQVLPASFHCADDVLPQVRWAREQRRKTQPAGQSFGAFNVTEREAREAQALTFGMISMVDDALGEILRTLEETGLRRDTVIVFTSDHGDYLGDHSLLLKGPLHLNGLLRVPLILSDPRSGASARRVSPHLCSSLDISSTILDLCAIQPYNGLQGRSLLEDARADGKASAPDGVLIEDDSQAPHLGFSIAPRIRTIVTERYRLSVYGRTGHAELFDLADDPHELNNRWASAAHAGVRASLMEELAMLEMEAADTSPWPVYAA